MDIIILNLIISSLSLIVHLSTDKKAASSDVAKRLEELKFSRSNEGQGNMLGQFGGNRPGMPPMPQMPGQNGQTNRMLQQMPGRM